MENKVNELKLYLVKNKVKQRELSKKSNLGITTLHNLINLGKGSPKTINAVVRSLNDDFGLDITEIKVSNMLKKMAS